jgi:hypothetical protein
VVEWRSVFHDYKGGHGHGRPHITIMVTVTVYIDTTKRAGNEYNGSDVFVSIRMFHALLRFCRSVKLIFDFSGVRILGYSRASIRPRFFFHSPRRSMPPYHPTIQKVYVLTGIAILTVPFYSPVRARPEGRRA